MKYAAALLLPLLACAAAAQEPSAPSADRLSALEARIQKLETAPAGASIGSFNPAIGLALDSVVTDQNSRAKFDFRAAELNLESAVDPFLKAWTVITGSNGGVAVEEAAVQTTALPYGLTVRAGRLFAPFGRFSMWHDHELPMVYRPNSLASYVGNEAHADGLDVNYLFPVPFYFEGTVGAYNRLGADNTRTDIATARPFDRWTYLGRLHAYGDVTDNVGFDVGVSEAWTPKRDSVGTSAGTVLVPKNDSWRALSGVDLTLRYQPSVGGLYKGVIWTTEVLQNDERLYDDTGAGLGRTHSYAGFSNVETKLGRVVRAGGFADVTELPNSSRSVSRTAAGYLTFEITEFDRIRLQYSHTWNNFPGELSSLPGTDFGSNDLARLHRGDTIAVQWTAIIGYHVHGFRGRWGA